jgi:uncharacterized RDD family membrane protein YckC
MGENSVPTPESTGKHGKRVSAAVVRSAIGFLLALAAIALVAGCATGHTPPSISPIPQSASLTPFNAAQTAPASTKETA